MDEFEKLLGDMGLEQWVRNKFIGKLADFKQQESTDVDRFIAEFNAEILREFKEVANKAVADVITKASTLMSAGAVQTRPPQDNSKETN